MSLFDRDHSEVACGEGKTSCTSCGNDGLVLGKRQLGYALTVLAGLGFALFMIGYFIGQRTAAEQFAVKMAQESLSDRIHSSLYAIQGHAQQDSSAQEASSDQDPGVVATEADAVDTAITSSAVAAQQPLKQRFYAQITGFGNEQTARAFVKRMKDKNIHVLVRPRHSKTARGKQITWYQIVSETLDSRETVDALVETMRRQEHINSIRVITC